MYRKWWIFYDYLLISIGEREKDRMANEKTDVKERKRRTDRQTTDGSRDGPDPPPSPGKLKFSVGCPNI